MEWVPAIDLLRALNQRMNAGEAVIAICTRAHLGLLRSRADRLFKNGVPQPENEIDPGFWWANGYEALDQNWEVGDFSTRIERPDRARWNDPAEHWQAFGVSFLRDDAEKMGVSLGAPADEFEDLRALANGHSAFEKPRWDYVEALAWVMSRDPAVVNGIAGVRARFASSPTHDREATAQFMLMGDAFEPGAVFAAEADIARRAAANQLQVKGRVSGGDLLPIEPQHWDNARVYLHHGDWVLAPADLFDAKHFQRTQWSDLRFDAGEAREVWPGNLAESADAPVESQTIGENVRPQSRVKQSRVEQWFRDERCPAFEGMRPPTWQQCWEAAKQHFAPDRVVREVLLDARAAAAPPDWRKPGPRRSED